VQIHLNEAEQRLARFLASKRHAENRKRGTPDKKIGAQSADEIDLDGVAAEIAVAKCLNVFPDLSTDHAPDADCLTRFGHWVDVKSTRYKNGRLLAAPWKGRGAADWYVLCVGTFPSYRIAGVISGTELISESRKTDLGHGPTYAVCQGDLTPINKWMSEHDGEAAA
jgi:hypothetical protein